VAAQVDFFFSPASRYSYLASTQIRSLELDTCCTVVWRPVHGPDIRHLRGRDPFSGPPLSGQYEPSYRRSDAEAWAELYGVPFQEPREFDFDYRLLVRAAVAGQHLGAGADFLRALAAAVFASGHWPIDQALLVELAETHGLDPQRFTGELNAAAVEESMARAAREAFERGAFGVPTFFVGARMFWGNDRIPLLRHYLETHARVSDEPGAVQ
jgi:2-hydroxychromene-2-carboxylate isomerase